MARSDDNNLKEGETRKNNLLMNENTRKRVQKAAANKKNTDPEGHIKDKGKYASTEVVVNSLIDKEETQERQREQGKTGQQIGFAQAKNSNKLIKPEVQDYIRHVLYDPDPKTGKGWIFTYIDKTLKKAMADPDGKSGQIFARVLFEKDDLLGDLDRSISKERKNDRDFQLYRIRKTLYDKQQEVFDNDIDKQIIIINSRRSGKTELMGRLIVKALLKEDAHVVYINRNSSAAIRQIRGPLQTALDAIGLDIVQGSVEAQEAHFSNGGQLLVIGNNNSADIDKLRGERISLCILDECAHQKNTRQLIREVIGPALKDYADSQLVMVGTPPRNKGTYIEELWGRSDVKKYHWTFLDNPFIPNRDQVIDEVCKETGATPDSAFIRREYFGDMNAYDDDALWIKKYSVVDMQQIRNTPVWSHAWVGVDWGYEDKAAVISVVATNNGNRAYVVDSWSEAHKGIKEISDEIKRQYDNLRENYVISRDPWVICDNNEKSAVSDLYHVYNIKNVFTAYKYDKDMALDHLNDFLSSNKICFLKDKSDSLIEDANNTLWKRDEETDKILHEIDDDIWHPNSLMALLYVSRQFAIDVLNMPQDAKPARPLTRMEEGIIALSKRVTRYEKGE